MALTTDLGIIISAAAVTVSQVGPDLFNYNSKGAVIFVSTDGIGTGSITVTIQGKDNLSGKYYTILASAAIAAQGFTVMRVYPGLTAIGNQTATDVIPYTWRVITTANNANAANYTISGALIA